MTAENTVERYGDFRVVGYDGDRPKLAPPDSGAEWEDTPITPTPKSNTTNANQ